MNVRTIIVLAVMGTLAIAGGAYAYGAHHNAYHCVAGPGEKCASDQFVKDWREYRDLVQKYNPPPLPIPKDDQVRIDGLHDLLNREAVAYGATGQPGGTMQWDQGKERFVVIPPDPKASLKPATDAKPAPTPASTTPPVVPAGPSAQKP